jgi:hypothetical protein
MSVTARVWARNWVLPNHAGVCAAAVALSLAVGVIVAEALLWTRHWSAVPDWIGRSTAAVTAAAALALINELRRVYSDVATRRTVGALWDVGTYCPRAASPLAPPCYAERAIPELVDRVIALTGAPPSDASDRGRDGAAPPNVARPGSVLITGYSQGATLAPTVVAQLPREVLPKVGLLTMASALRRLYGRAFPAYFADNDIDDWKTLLSSETDDQDGVNGPVRWRNVVRNSDYIGGWVESEPIPATDPAALDSPCLDPAAIIRDTQSQVPPVHQHSDWWQDVCTEESARQVIKLLPTAAISAGADSGVDG